MDGAREGVSAEEYDRVCRGFLDTVAWRDERIKELEAQLERYREAVQAAIDCGMVPSSSAKDGGAAKYGEQVRVADMLRAALEPLEDM